MRLLGIEEEIDGAFGVTKRPVVPAQSRNFRALFSATHGEDQARIASKVWSRRREPAFKRSQAVAEALGYTAEELTSILAEANMGLSGGNPTATAHLRPGEVVVYLGSDGGLDVFLSSKQVGPKRKAIGIGLKFLLTRSIASSSFQRE